MKLKNDITNRFTAKKPKIFYGWYVVMASFIVLIYFGGIITYGFSAFIQPMAKDLGWSYTSISFAASLRGVETGLLAPLAGILIDRFGPKKIMVGGVILAGSGLLLLSQVYSLLIFYTSFVLIGIGTSFCLDTAIIAAVSNWFRKRIGIANGIALSGYGISGLAVPLIVKLIDDYGWRATALYSGLGASVLTLIVFLLVKDKPEKYGLLPDIEEDIITTNLDKENRSKQRAATPSFSVKQVLKTRAFWQLSIPLTFVVLAFSAVSAHIIPYLSSVNIDRTTAGLAVSGLTLVSIGGRLGFGWLSDRFSKKIVTALALISIVLGLVFFSITSASMMLMLVPFFVFYGFGHGGARTLIGPLVKEYYGMKNFATVVGLINGVSAIGSILGPILAGWFYDTQNSYHAVWPILAVLLVFGVFSLVTAPGALTRELSRN